MLVGKHDPTSASLKSKTDLSCRSPHFWMRPFAKVNTTHISQLHVIRFEEIDFFLCRNAWSIATKKQAVAVYEAKKNATLEEIFGLLGTDLDKLCLTQAQIKNFCKKYPKWLCKNGDPTFFLFKIENQFFVVYVCVDPEASLYVFADSLKYSRVWFSKNYHRLIVPQLTS